VSLIRLIFVAFLALSAFPQISPGKISPGKTPPRDQAAQLASFELVWSTVRDRHPDPTLNGLNWQVVHDSFRPRIALAQSPEAVRDILREMIGKLGVSHYAIIPGDFYAAIGDAPASKSGDASAGIETVIVDGKAIVRTVETGSPAARAGVQPGMVLQGIDGTEVAPLLGKADELRDTESRRIASRSVTRKLAGPADSPVALDLLDASGQPRHVELNRAAPPKDAMVRFGNLPETRLEFESRTLPGGIGYIRFSEFLDPVTLMPRFESALHDFSKVPGIVLDLRGNPGGIGIMAMGIAGFFIDKSGLQLGEMKMRTATLRFTVFPRQEIYSGRLAILIDEGSASTTEILAQGLQDLKRARIFGTRSAGAALPSDIIRLPNGDGFQYPTASYTSTNGKVLEGNGVIPDVEVHQSVSSIAAGEDTVIDAATRWIAADSR
jgi:carboxyl-terminal processing protease